MRVSTLGVAAALALAFPAAALAEEHVSNDQLAAQATDPIASLMSFQLNDWYTPRFHGLDDSANQLVFRAEIPFSFAAMSHLLRIA